MRKEELQKIVTRHGNKIKTIGSVFAIMIMLLAIKTYVNYSTITDEIEKVNNDINATNQEIAYAENFYSKYLDSEYAMYFLSHKNNVLFDGEYIIKISTTPNEIENNNTKDEHGPENHETPQESRNRFIKSKIN